MSLLSCKHVAAYKKEKDSNPESGIHSLSIASSTQSALSKKIEEGSCYKCKTRSHRLHACLDCMLVGCFERNHIQQHSKTTGHYIGIDITFGHVYCLICNDYMYDSEFEALSDTQYDVFWQFTEREAVLYKECDANDREEHSKFLGLRGLANLGNTSFMNCIIQVLTHNPLLRNYFLSDKHNINTCHFKCEGSICLACEMNALFHEFYSGKSTPYIPYKLYTIWRDAKDYNAGDVADGLDAHEVFLKMREILHEHSKGNEEESSCQCIVHKIFSGFLQSDIVCMNCNNVRTNVEEFQDICLYLGKTDGSEGMSLNDCLYSFTQPEQIHSKCDDCQQSCLSTKQLSVQKLPVVISFVLKRLEPGRLNTTHVSFPEYLDMTPFVSSNRGSSTEANRGNHYNSLNSSGDNNYCLFAVVNHYGNKGGVCYTAFIKRKQKWYRSDDDIITLASLEDVLNSKGYLLFYHKEVF